MTSSEESLRRKVRCPAELHNSTRYPVGMGLFLVRVLKKLLGHALSTQTGGHKVVPFVAQYAYEFGGQSFIEQINDDFSIRFVAGRHRSVFHVLAGTITQSFNVAEKWSRVHKLSFPAWMPRIS